MKLIYGVKDRPQFGKLIVFALQQLLAIMAATLVVPIIIGHDMSPAAALFGAGAGTLVYVLCTKAKSPVFLGSSFAFKYSMPIAFAGSVSMALGYAGLIIGACCAALVYVIIAIIVKKVGTKWIDKIMPAVIIGPTVAIIGLTMAPNAIGDLFTANSGGNSYIAMGCGLVALFVVMLCSSYGKKTAKLIPFVIGILAGFAVATVLTLIGNAANIEMLGIVNFSPIVNNFTNISIKSFISVPSFTFLTAFGGFKEITGAYVLTIAVAYAPVAFVVFAEHIADHKNLSTIVGKDLLKDPGLSRTLLGDGIGSAVGAFFGGCPNTTYGESIGCVAISKNASIATIITASVMAMIISFFTPFVALINTIPSCVMGGVCMSLYGFISVSGLKMLKDVDLNKNANLFTAAVILIAGIGGFVINIGTSPTGHALVTITEIACALLLGVITNLILKKAKE